MDYLTIDAMQTLLSDPAWHPTSDDALNLALANAWLNAFNLPKYSDPALIPNNIKLAGFQIYQGIATGELMQGHDGRIVKSERVKADTVESQTEYYMDNGFATPISRFEVMAKTLLAPYIIKPTVGGIFGVRVTR